LVGRWNRQLQTIYYLQTTELIMCSPAAIPIATAILGAGSAGLQYAGQRRQAKQQAQFQQRAADAERQRSLMEQSSIRIRQAQEQEATAREIGEVSKKAREAMATATVSAGESGVAGLSVDALLDDYTRQEATYRMGVTRQQEMKDLQTGLALTDAGFRSQNRLIDINRPINRQSFLTGAMNVASSGLSGLRTGLELKRELS
jgi:hypothetical protein